MNETTINPTIESTAVERAHNLAGYYASELRTKVTQNQRGPQKRKYLVEFKKCFDELYLLTHFREGIDSDIEKQVHEWMNKNQRSTNQNILHSIDLFQMYEKELYNNKVIES